MGGDFVEHRDNNMAIAIAPYFKSSLGLNL